MSRSVVVVVDAWRLSVGTLTAWPVQPPGLVDRSTGRLSLLLGPIAVIPLAVLVSAVGMVAAQGGAPPLVVGLVVVGSVAMGTRGLHLDGLADTADGLASGHDRERSLQVMKTGTSGPAGVTTLVLVLGVQVVAVSALVTSVQGAILVACALCVSRVVLLMCCLRGIPGARTTGLGATFTSTVPPAWAAPATAILAAGLCVAASWAGLPWWRGAVATVVGLVAAGLLLIRCVRRLGGVSGDVLGACIEITFAGLLVGLA